MYLKALLSLILLSQAGPLILSVGCNYSKLKWNWDLFDENGIGLTIKRMSSPNLNFHPWKTPKKEAA